MEHTYLPARSFVMGKTVKVLLTAAGVMGASALLLLAGAALVLSLIHI